MKQNFKELVQKHRDFFESQATKPLSFRLKQLGKLESLVTENADEIIACLAKDLHKPAMESVTTEIVFLLEEIKFIKKHLSNWVKPQSVCTPLILKPGKSTVYAEPVGVVLILSPWNYPFQLALAPLVGALAAGNCAVIKPSELAPHTSKLICSLVPKYFEPSLVAVVEGGVEETTELLKIRFDHIFFTGSTNVGKVIAKAAAEHLCPVTLELGGKSPAIVTQSADVDLAARRIAWGKYLNAGQTCVAPDFALVHSSIADKFHQKLGEYIRDFYGSDPKQSPDYCRIINQKNFDRLSAYLNPPHTIALGGASHKESLYIEPTILKNVSWSDPVMKDEIFGPILPVLTFDDFHKALGQAKTLEKPLAAYLFSSSDKEISSFLNSLAFGGGCINDVIMHLSNPELPFGGTGHSGLGAYHGKRSFDVFSHFKSVLHKSRHLDFGVRYPPYADINLKRIRSFFKI